MFGRLVVENHGTIEIGARVRFMSEFAPVELRTGKDGRLTIGDRTGINYGTAIHAVDSVTIGRNVDMGPHCLISDTDTGTVDHPERSDVKPVVIGDGAWLASRVTVLPGSTIGAGAVITAGSVVDGAIPSRVVAGGIPARVLRSLDGHEAPVMAREYEAGSEPEVAVEPRRPVAPVVGRGLLISDFTIEPLALALERPTATVRLDADVAPYGTVVPTLLAPASEGCDFAVVWTRPDAILSSFARLVGGERVDAEDLRADVGRFAELVTRGLAKYTCVVVPTWTVPPWMHGGALTEGRPGGVLWGLNLVNQALMEATAPAANVFVLDASRWLAAAGEDAQSERLWFLGKVPFDERVFEQAADEIAAAFTAVRGGARKLVVVDLDNTLWGGVVGDDGWESLRLGGHDSVGEAFVEFQRALKQLKAGGVLLGIASKNDEPVALEAIERHSAMVLERDDFVAWRINWDDKAANIVSLVSELSLGLQSVVFIDDHPHERARVRAALPEVLVPEWPSDPTYYARALRSLTCFGNPQASAEDADRTRLYIEERERTELLASVGSIDEWIRDLGVVVRAQPLDPGNSTRATQLLNKTNQLNLTTRRLTESQLSDWAAGDGHATWCMTVSDRLGDAGLTGIVSVAVESGVATLVDYVLSCRVMGRRVEAAVLHLATRLALDLGARRLVATLIPTAKNEPCRRFFDECGFSRRAEHVYEWDLVTAYPAPADVTVEAALGRPDHLPA